MSNASSASTDPGRNGRGGASLGNAELSAKPESPASAGAAVGSEFSTCALRLLGRAPASSWSEALSMPSSAIRRGWSFPSITSAPRRHASSDSSSSAARLSSRATGPGSLSAAVMSKGSTTITACSLLARRLLPPTTLLLGGGGGGSSPKPMPLGAGIGGARTGNAFGGSCTGMGLDSSGTRSKSWAPVATGSATFAAVGSEGSMSVATGSAAFAAGGSDGSGGSDDSVSAGCAEAANVGGDASAGTSLVAVIATAAASAVDCSGTSVMTSCS
mmetsp:Transcript_34836/g.61179  ORF Transcript_34836/g.61179 Transcript_34836/m.61179 type:complete len:273 (-) Transcript_34836:151-969(-)